MSEVLLWDVTMRVSGLRDILSEGERLMKIDGSVSLVCFLIPSSAMLVSYRHD